MPTTTTTPKPTPISISFTPQILPRPAAPPTSQQKRPSQRLGSGFESDGDDDGDDDAHRGKIQVVTAFDSSRGGALGAHDDDGDGTAGAKEGPLVIASAGNRDWRAEAEKRRGGGKKAVYLPPEAYAKKNGDVVVAAAGVTEVDNTGEGEKYGLQVFERRREEEEEIAIREEGTLEQVKPKSEEELALDALLNGDKPKNTLVLAPVAPDFDWRTTVKSLESREEDAYKQDVASRPDVPSLDDYEAVPVHEFGAALLRGMGWKEGQEVGKGRGQQAKVKNVEKRPAFLGIGAKPKEEVPELGTWGKADKRRGTRRADTTYVPVLLVNKKTGQPIDEVEAKASGHEKSVESSRRDRSRERGGGEKSGRRDRDRSYDYSDRRRRHRSRDGGPRRGSDTDQGREHDGERRRDDNRNSRRRDERRLGDGRDRRRHSHDRGYDRRDRR